MAAGACRGSREIPAERKEMERKENRKNRRWLILAALAAAAILACATVFCPELVKRREPETAVSQGGMVVDTRSTGEKNGETAGNPLAGRSVYFSGIEDAAISREAAVRLDNREENLDFLLRYEIYDDGTGEMVFETGLIPSGQYVEWVPGETLEPGEYTLNFLQIPYYPEATGKYVGLTQGSNQVTLAILD